MSNFAKEQSKPIRMQHRFWLDINRNEESDLDAYVLSLKKNRSFASTIRDALHLIRDLRQQRLDVLFALFPFVYLWLEERAEAIARGMNKALDEPDSKRSENEISRQLARLEQLLLQQSAGAQNGGMHLNLLSAPRVAKPLRDEPAIEITQAKSDEKPAYNFMISNAKSGLIPLENLPREVIEYGVQKGRLPASLLPKQPSPKKNKGKKRGLPEPPVAPDDTHLVTVTALQASTTIKKMAIPDIAAPRFDEVDDDIDLFS